MKEFKNFLLHQNLSKNTIESYVTAIGLYFNNFDEITKQNLLAFKAFWLTSIKAKQLI